MPTNLLTWDYYSDRSIFDLERHRIFGRQWFFAAHTSFLAERRDAVADRICNDSYIIRQGDDKRIHAYRNQCRHRGAPLLKIGPHSNSLLRCPYHGWLYNDSGELVSTPGFNDESNLPCQHETLSLQPLDVGIARNLVFLNYEIQSQSLLERLEPVDDLLDTFDITALEFDSVLNFEFECNWKLYVENWLESYHFPWMHNAFVKDVDTKKYSLEIRDKSVVHRSFPKNVESIYSGTWIWLWPFTAFNSYDGGISIERIVPITINRTRIEFSFLFHPDVSRKRRQNARQLCETVTLEDGRMCEMVHESISGGKYVPGPLSPKHEPAIAYFHKLLRSCIDS